MFRADAAGYLSFFDEASPFLLPFARLFATRFRVALKIGVSASRPVLRYFVHCHFPLLQQFEIELIG